MSINRNLTTIWIAIAFVLACKELSRRTGVVATDWGKELRQWAFEKLNQLSDQQLVAYIKANFTWDE